MTQGKDRALIVEDSRTTTLILKHFLQLEGFEVLVATDGIVGLETAQCEQPDVILTDNNMPRMGGLDLVRALRADARTNDIPICMLTSDESAESEQRARELGVDEYIYKSVDSRRLAARVRAVVDSADKKQSP